MARYAEGTTVSIDQSRAEMTSLLTRYGVMRMAWATEPERDTLQFELAGHTYRLWIERPSLEQVQAAWDDLHPYAAAGQRANLAWSKKLDDEWRRRWRANVLLLKAKLEFADGETSSVERELMPYMLLKDGRTVEQALDTLPLMLAAGS